MQEQAETVDAAMQEALAELMQTMGLELPDEPLTVSHLQEANKKLKEMLEPPDMQEGVSVSNVTKISAHRPRGKFKNVLITGQLGIIIHQLRHAITKLGGEVTIARDMDEAIALYQKRDFSLVIIDLFMPTEREGLIVLEEIRRLSTVCNIKTQVVVLSPLSKDMSIKERCKNKGAAFFLEKMEGWHKTILQYFMGDIPEDQFEITA